MTLRYVRTGAGGAATGADWANAYLTLSAALNASAAGDTIYVSEDHAETLGSSITLTSPGTAASPVKAICVNHSGSVPPVSADIRTTGTVTCTGSSNLSFAGGPAVYDGITFTGTTTTGHVIVAGAVDGAIKFRNCALRIGGSSSSSKIDLGNTSSGGTGIELYNTTMRFTNVGQGAVINADVLWTNTPSAITGATIPTTLFLFTSSRGAKIDCRGVDFSALGSGNTIVGNSSGQIAVQALLTDCKIGASVTIGATPTAKGQGGVDYLRIDSGGTNYKHGRIRYEGTETEETTVVLSGGASDGATPISHKIVTTANCSEHFPYESIPIAIWNTTTGSSVNAAVQGIWGGGAVPNNDDIWLEVEYLGDASFPMASFVNDGKADLLAAAAGQAAGSGTWGGSTTKFKLDASFTAQQVGWIFCRVKAAKASSTFYIDPKVTLS
ncbi:hypothetical protein NKJ66_07350 [Mesorhizobium sp. M0078]|uniref:hypothetical protein n=1 Tax=Mesorhizobium sp. M0078 TaxID=2956871 RepID=UPI003336BB3B